MSIDTQSRPAGLGHTAVLMCVFNCLGVVFYNPSQGSLAAFLLRYVVVASLSFVVIWYYWQGQNWARWLVLVASALSLANLVMLPSFPPGGVVVGVAEAAFGAWMLYWLNTKPMRSYFHRPPPRPTFSRAALVSITGVLIIAALAVAAMGLSMMYSPTPRPVYDAGISAAHRQALGALYPEDERLLGLFSMGVFDVVEEGCFFTDSRIVVFEAGKVVSQATFAEVRALRLSRDKSFIGMSELAIGREDGNELYCKLPNAAAYSNDAAEFHARVASAWRRVKDRAGSE